MPLERRADKYSIFIWDKSTRQTKVKINFKEVVLQTFFAGLEYVVVQKNTINVYNIHKFFLYQKFEKLDNIIESKMLRIDDVFWLVFLIKDRSSIEIMKVSHDFGYPRHMLKIFDKPIKLMNFDATGQYIIFVSENDKEIAIVDCYKQFEIVRRISFTSADKRWDDVLKHELVFIGFSTPDVVIMINNQKFIRIIDLSIYKPHVLNVIECQKYLKFEFKIQESAQEIPKVTEDTILSHIVKTDYKNSGDSKSSITIVS